jgi:hypothetical protein
MHLMTELMFIKNISKKLPSRDIQFLFQPRPKEIIKKIKDAQPSPSRFACDLLKLKVGFQCMLFLTPPLFLQHQKP